jgi:hypothetical protein
MKFNRAKRSEAESYNAYKQDVLGRNLNSRISLPRHISNPSNDCAADPSHRRRKPSSTTRTLVRPRQTTRTERSYAARACPKLSSHKEAPSQASTYKSVGGTKTTTASAYLLAKTTHSALLASFVNPVYLAHSSHISVRKRQSVLTLLMGFHWFLALKLRLPKSWRWQLGTKLNLAGRSGLRVHLSEFQLKQLGDLALRAVSNFVMPRVGQFWTDAWAQGEGGSRDGTHSSRT